MNIDIRDEGTIILFTPRDRAAREWLANNVVAESWQRIGETLAIDRRCARKIIDLLEAIEALSAGM